MGRILAVMLLVLGSGCAKYGAAGNYLAALLLLRPASYNPVNQIQGGLINMTASSTTITVNSVDPSRSFLLCYFRTSASDPASVPTCEISSSTQVLVQTGGSSTNYWAQWYLVEFAAGAAAQRGNVTFVPGDTSKTITLSPSVDTAHSFALVTARMGSLNHTLDAERTIRAVITGPNTLTLSRNTAGTVNVDVHWQVMQLQDTTIQPGTVTIGAGSQTATAGISPVDLSRSFIFYNYRADPSSGGYEEEYLSHASFANASTVSFTREATANTLDISFFAVQMNDSTVVRSGSVATSSFASPNTATQMTAAIGSVKPSSSIAVTSASVKNLGGGNQSDLDSGSWVPQITSSTGMQFDRGSNQDRLSTLDYFAVQFVQ